MSRYDKFRVAAWFWLGHFFSKMLDLVDAEWWASMWYPLYSWCMLRSAELDYEGYYWEPPNDPL